jgi:anti-anti-sigma regulatory factor
VSMIQRVEAGKELSHGAIADLGATLSDQVARGVTAIQLNTSRVVDFDSQALESLVEFDELAKSRGLTFVVSDPSDLLTLALTITGLKGRLDIKRGEAA